jgi:hypothetical protein
MTPKRKAWRLFVDYRNILNKIPSEFDIKQQAKQCALIAVDEILSVLFQHHKIDYWKEVKHEIENL